MCRAKTDKIICKVQSFIVLHNKATDRTNSCAALDPEKGCSAWAVTAEYISLERPEKVFLRASKSMYLYGSSNIYFNVTVMT